MDLRDELDVRLDSVLRKDAHFSYVYDFGDWWEHLVTVEEVVMPEAGTRYPYCVGGFGACPPEDVGGAAGFQQFMAAISDPSDPEHEQMLEWYGREYDPLEFNAERASALMRRMA
jgi:Plasmid pRiA4b ORF-3-like protein